MTEMTEKELRTLRFGIVIALLAEDPQLRAQVNFYIQKAS